MIVPVIHERVVLRLKWFVATPTIDSFTALVRACEFIIVWSCQFQKRVDLGCNDCPFCLNDGREESLACRCILYGGLTELGVGYRQGAHISEMHLKATELLGMMGDNYEARSYFR